MKRLLFALFALGCGASKPLPPLDVRTVAWTDVPLGRVAAVAEADDVVTVFSDRGAVVLSGGVELAVDPSVKKWVSAASIPAADGNGSWMVGVDDAGRVYRVRDRRVLERVAPRYGLQNAKVRAVVALGQGRVAFRLDNGLALTDGEKVARYDYAFESLAGGLGRGIGLGAAGVRVFDPFAGFDRTFAVPEARWVGFDSRGRVVVENAHALWLEDDPRALVVPGEPRLSLMRKGQKPLHGLATSGDHVWFGEGDELGAMDDRAILRSSGLKLPEDATLLPASGGDVWALADGKLLRYSSAHGASTFDTQVAPIARRVCAQCHGAGAMIPLVTKSDWEAMRATIQARVVLGKTMPPKGTPLSDDERAAIGAWATR